MYEPVFCPRKQCLLLLLLPVILPPTPTPGFRYRIASSKPRLSMFAGYWKRPVSGSWGPLAIGEQWLCFSKWPYHLSLHSRIQQNQLSDTWHSYNGLLCFTLPWKKWGHGPAPVWSIQVCLLQYTIMYNTWQAVTYLPEYIVMSLEMNQVALLLLLCKPERWITFNSYYIPHRIILKWERSW